jgi:hypothetical protein
MNCECGNGQTLVGLQCKSWNNGGVTAVQVFNGVATALTQLVWIALGAPNALLWKLVDLSQLFALFQYSGSPDFR